MENTETQAAATNEAQAAAMTEQTGEQPMAQNETPPDAEKPHGDIEQKLADITREARKWEQRAKENYEKAKQAEKLDAEIAELRAKAEEASVQAMRYRIAVEFGLTIDDADLLLNATDEEKLRAQAARLQAVRSGGKMPPIESQGRSAKVNPSKQDQFFDAIQASFAS